MVVFIDGVTESKYGPVPLERSVLARAISALAEAGTKGVVLKFFLDREKDSEGDRLLASLLSEFPVILQARIDDYETSPNDLPKKFTLGVNADTAISGSSGWIPISQFSAAAHDIGFIEFDGFPVPLIETYKGRIVKSLFLYTIELAVDKKVSIAPKHQVMVGDINIELKQHNQTPIDQHSIEEIDYLPFHEILETDGWISRAKDKVVILGYDGPEIHKIETAHGAVPAHRLFVHVLQSLFQGGT